MRLHAFTTVVALAATLVGGATGHALGDEFSFDVSAYEKRPFELGGYVEFLGEKLFLDQESAAYQLNFFDAEERETIDRYTGTLELEGVYRKDIYTLSIHTHSEIRYDHIGEDQDHLFFEALFTAQPNPGLSLDIGKKVNRWGKGYAWNPVGFVERTKDPLDPDLSREGFWLIGADWIRSLEGPLQSVAFTPLVVPVDWGLNDDFGESPHTNPAAKLYMLYRDTDIDLMFLAKGSRTARYGLDFSRNLATNLEIHGEFAYVTDFERRVISPSGEQSIESEDVVNYLLGLRYLTEFNMTLILEYYRNGQGFTEEQMEDFFRLVHQAWDTDNDELLSRLSGLSSSAYGRNNPMRHYAYLKASWKEPFDVLYFVPSFTAVVNLDDQSFQLVPELLYRGITDMELRFRLNVPVGDELTEYGEKQNDYKAEFRVRYFF